MNGLREYPGVVHVHTAYSDSAGRMPYVIECARKAGAAFVVLADHNSVRAKLEGWEGWHDGVLLVIGVEVTSLKGHALVIGLDHCPYWRNTHPEEYLPEVARLGGTAFVAHPERANRGKLYHSAQAWPALATDAYAGIEVWSYMHDWIEWAYPWRMISAIRQPDSAIAGPHPEVLRAWDAVALRRRVSGLGALDAHEYRLPVPKLRWCLLKVLPADYVYGTVRTHVFLPEWSGDAAEDIVRLRDALAGGHCFIAYDLVGDSTGTRFFARRGAETVLMGDEVAAGAELEFVVSLPGEADVALLRNTEAVASARGRELVHGDARPGVYRVEAHRAGRPWVFSNHIYVR